jgi:hypothetical protein
MRQDWNTVGWFTTKAIKEILSCNVIYVIILAFSSTKGS